MKKITAVCLVFLCSPFVLSPAIGQQTSNEKQPSRIVVSAMRGGKAVIISVPVDGSGEKVLLDDPVAALEPTVAPDGKRIAFVSYREGGPAQIFVGNIFGMNPQNITQTKANERSPAWSPDGKTIVFASYRTGDCEIFLINPDGSNPRNLTQNIKFDADPVWSPDGKRIAFAAHRGDAMLKLFTMQADGAGEKPLIADELKGWLYPDWSPDGKMMAFGKSEFSPTHTVLHILDLASGKRRTIAKAPGVSSYPRWSPDGQYLAFAYFEDRPPAPHGAKLKFPPEARRGDLMVYNMKTGKTRVVLKNALHPWGPRPCWMPLGEAD